MGLLQRLDQLDVGQNRISDDHFDKMRRLTAILGKETMTQISKDIFKLSDAVEHVTYEAVNSTIREVEDEDGEIGFEDTGDRHR